MEGHLQRCLDECARGPHLCHPSESFPFMPELPRARGLTAALGEHRALVLRQAARPVLGSPRAALHSRLDHGESSDTLSAVPPPHPKCVHPPASGLGSSSALVLPWTALAARSAPAYLSKPKKRSAPLDQVPPEVLVPRQRGQQQQQEPQRKQGATVIGCRCRHTSFSLSSGEKSIFLHLNHMNCTRHGLFSQVLGILGSARGKRGIWRRFLPRYGDAGGSN